jgi:hypothetical protein
MPLLQAACDAAGRRAFFGPSKKGIAGSLFAGDGVAGRPKAFELDSLSSSAEGKQLLWEASERAIGQPFFGQSDGDNVAGGGSQDVLVGEGDGMSVSKAFAATGDTFSVLDAATTVPPADAAA